MENPNQAPRFEAAPPPPVTQGEVLPHQSQEHMPGPAARPEGYGERDRPAQPVQQQPQQQVQTLKPQPAAPAVDFQQQAQIVSSRAPQSAGDIDTIEPVWIKYIKKSINKNKDDPYSQAQELSYLQADYLKKRFAKELKVPED